MKRLITLTLLSTLFVSCNVQEIELGVTSALDQAKFLSTSCSLSNYDEPSGPTYTNISTSFEPQFSVTTTLDLINEGVSFDGSSGKCSVIKTFSSCPTCKTIPTYEVRYTGSKEKDSDRCTLNDGTTVTIDFSDKNNPTCSSLKITFVKSFNSLGPTKTITPTQSRKTVAP